MWLPDTQQDRDAKLAARLDELEAENTKLRAMLAKSNADCPYCGLPQAEMNQCALGFPGCARADDLVNEP